MHGIYGTSDGGKCRCRFQRTCASVQEIWPADTTPVEGNKDALDSAFLPGDELDMQDVVVRMLASSLAPATALLELV